MATLAVILSELFALDFFQMQFCVCSMSSVLLKYDHDTSQLCIAGHDDVSCTRMTTHPFILSELFPLDGFRCNFVSAS